MVIQQRQSKRFSLLRGQSNSRQNSRQRVDMKSIATLFALVACFVLPPPAYAQAEESAATRGEKPFVLIARLHALAGESEKVMQLSKAADKAVKASEPGMLLHTFDQDPADPQRFVWTEVYENSAALVFHLENPPLQQYLAEVSPLLSSFTVELYGEVSAEAVTLLRSTGTPTTHFKTRFGYIRDLTP